MTSAQGQIWDYYQNVTPEIFDENTGRLRFILKHLKQGERVLDIGVGNGAFEALALAHGIEVWALDPSPASIERLKALPAMAGRARAGNVEEIPFDTESFDAVVMSEVLEHLDEGSLGKALTEVRRVLVRGGRFLGTVPARENLQESVVACPKCAHSFHRWGHQRTFSPQSVHDMLTPYFRVECLLERKFVTFERPRGIAKLVALAKLCANRLGVRMPNESFFFIGRKQ